MLTEINSVKNAILCSLAESKIYPIQVLLIGSLARGTARSNSDADIMICFKRNRIPSEDDLYNLIRVLEYKIGRNVDLIVFEFIKKFVNHDFRDLDFIDNASTDARQIIDGSKVGKEFIQLSNKIGLLKLIN